MIVVVEENHGYSSVIGSAAMPYLNGLATQYSLATQYYADTHPSIGNYLMMTSGQIVTNDDAFMSTISVPNIVQSLIAAGKTWKSYAESLPSVGYTGGDVYPYVRHHNPLSFYADVVNSSAQTQNLVPFTQFTADLSAGQLPDYSFVVPNLNDDAHDCPAGMSSCTDADKLSAADSWLKSNIGPVLSNPQFQQGGLLLIVFDEAATSDTSHGGGIVPMVAVGPLVKQGYQSSNLYQHENLLKMVTTYLGINGNLGNAAAASSMSDLLK